jgi:hypothetical protein
MLVACRLAGLSALETHDAGIFALAQTVRDHRDGVDATVGYQ